MSQEITQSVSVSPSVKYTDPELQALQKEQFPEQFTDVDNEDTSNNKEEELTQDKEDNNSEPKSKEIKKDKEEEEEEGKDITEDLEDKPPAVTAENLGLPESFKPFVEDYYTNGSKLSQESLNILKEKHNLDADTIESWIKDKAEATELRYKLSKSDSLEKARSQEESEKALHAQVGGVDEWNAMLQWAGTDAPEDLVKEYNELIDSENPKVVSLAVDLLNRKWKEANPQAPTYIETTSNVSSGVKPFGSVTELAIAMGKPEYRNDPNYREMIQNRINISNNI